jgi:hypothetical protein
VTMSPDNARMDFTVAAAALANALGVSAAVTAVYVPISADWDKASAR